MMLKPCGSPVALKVSPDGAPLAAQIVVTAPSYDHLVLHDTFGLSFEEIAPIVGRSAIATRQLASRARRRVQGAASEANADLKRKAGLVGGPGEGLRLCR